MNSNEDQDRSRSPSPPRTRTAASSSRLLRADSEMLNASNTAFSSVTEIPPGLTTGHHSRVNSVPPANIRERQTYATMNPGSSAVDPSVAIPMPQPDMAPIHEKAEQDMVDEYGIKKAPLRQVERQKTVMRVQLFRGNLVLNCPVPDKLLANVKFQESEEVATVRYTAATCDPNDFIHQNYSLRSALYGRQTELMVVMTMYNEDEVLFCRTMNAVMKNIAYLCSRGRSRMWGPEGWKKVVVCIVSDGRHKVHPRVLQTLGIMGAYQEGIMKSEVNGKPVQAHIFEHTTQISIDSNLKIKGAEVPVQILFCLKEENKKKLNSHRWALNGFAPILRPNVCVLLDVGTKPSTQSMYYLWKEFDVNPSLGGACGEIAADTGRGCYKLTNPLVAAQNFEYKISNILDKPLESLFGYITVLPGAFSAYRYAALVNTAPGHGPLASYFEGEKLHDGSASIFKANMYLAEDRVLCFELVAKPKCDWVLKYVKAAKAETDVPEGIAEFISQRRRWLNGSFFALIYAMVHWHRIWSTGHSFISKLLFQVQLLYNLVNMFFTWFGIALFYITFFFLSQIAVENENPGNFLKGWGQYLFMGFRYLYLFAIIIIFIASLGNRPQGSKGIYIFCFFLFATIMALLVFLTGYTVFLALSSSKITGGAGAWILGNLGILISVAIQFAIYLISSILYGEPWHIITSFVQYLFLMPSFINVLMVYAFSNVHDVSWGTKGDNKAVKLGAATSSKADAETVEVELPDLDGNDLNSEYDSWITNFSEKPKEPPAKRDLATRLEDWYRTFRTRFVLSWMFSNAILVAVITYKDVIDAMGGLKDGNIFLVCVFFAFVGMYLFKFIGSVIYILNHWRTHYGSCRCC